MLPCHYMQHLSMMDGRLIIHVHCVSINCKADGRASWLAFGSLPVRFQCTAHSFLSNCQLLVKEWALSTGQPLRLSHSRESVVMITYVL